MCPVFRHADEKGGYRTTFIVERADGKGNVGPVAVHHVDPKSVLDSPVKIKLSSEESEVSWVELG